MIRGAVIVAVTTVAVIPATAWAAPELVNNAGAGNKLINAGFKLKGGAVTFETANKHKVVCTSIEANGKITSLNAGEIPSGVTLKGCTYEGNANLKCSTGNHNAGEVVTNPIAITLGDINLAKTKAGISLEPKVVKGLVGDLVCGCAEEVLIGEKNGGMGDSVIGEVMPLNAFVRPPGEEFTLQFTQAKGLQSPELFAGGNKDVLEFEGRGLGPFNWEQGGLEGTTTLLFEEEAKIIP